MTSTIRTWRVLPALALALLALFAASTGTALAKSASSGGPVATAAKKKKKPKKPKAPAKPVQPAGPFVANDATPIGIGGGPDDTIVQTLNLPKGNWILTAKVELGNNAAAPNSVSCK